MNTSNASKPFANEENPQRWARIVDVLDDGTLYTEDAERLWPIGTRLPSGNDERAEALHALSELTNDKIMFFTAHAVNEKGVLQVTLWLGQENVNEILLTKGYEESRKDQELK